MMNERNVNFRYHGFMGSGWRIYIFYGYININFIVELIYMGNERYHRSVLGFLLKIFIDAFKFIILFNL